MRASGGAEVIGWLVILVMASLADARPVTLKDRAKLRSGASATAELLGELQGGTSVEVLGEDGGWRQVQTPDGQTGYVWAEHLTGETDTRPPAANAEPPRGSDRSLGEQIRELQENVRALRERPEPATPADLDRLREEVQRLITTQEGLARRLDQHPDAAADPPPEPTIGATAVLLFAAAVTGWVASRLMQRRRDHRQRDRLRF